MPQVQIIETPYEIEIHGYGATAVNKDYVGTAFRLSDRLWKTIRENQIKNKGKNIWVYESEEKVFAGLELDKLQPDHSDLEHKSILLKKYAYYKHVGSYSLIKEVVPLLRNELKSEGYKVLLPYIEVYGHWVNDETKLETELLFSIK